MSEDKDIYERIGLTVDEANSCWDRDCINDLDLKEFDDPAKVLSDIISDDELSAKQKIYDKFTKKTSKVEDKPQGLS